MRFRTVSVLGFFGFLSLSVWAGEGDQIAPAEPNRSVQEVPLLVEFTEAELAAMTPGQRERAEALKEEIRQTLNVLTNIEFDLPEPVYDPVANPIDIIPLFQIDGQAHVERLAYDEQGKRKKLSKEQWKQLRFESLFKVEDPKNPGQYDLWEVDAGFHEGSKGIKIRLKKGLGRALTHLTIGLPRALWSNSVVSLARLKNIVYGLRNSLSLLVGLSETRPKYSESEVEHEITKARARLLQQDGLGLPEKETRDGKPRPLNGSELAKADSIVAEIQHEVHRDFESRYQSLRQEIEASFPDSLAKEDRPKALANALERQKFEAECRAIEGSADLDRIVPGLAARVAEHMRGLFILRQAENQIQAEMLAYRISLEKDLRAQHPLHSEDSDWLGHRIAQDAQEHYERIRAERYARVVQDLEAVGLHTSARAVQRSLEFLENEAPILREGLSEQEVAARKFTGAPVRIWKASNWIVREEKDHQGKTSYVADKYYQLPDVYTSPWVLWRLRLAAQRTRSVFKDWLYKLVVYNYWNGPLGVKSSFLKEPFPYLYSVDPNTGKILAESDRMGTYRSRLRSIQNYISSQRAAFEAAPDKGFLTKRFSRFWNILWYRFVVQTIAPTTLTAVQGGGFLLNTTITGAGVATSWAWAPLTAAVGLVFNPLVYDFDSPGVPRSSATAFRATNRLFALPSVWIGRIGIKGMLAGGLGVLRLLWEPGAAAGQATFSLARAGVRKVGDLFAELIFWAGGARIPAEDPNFVTHRIEGPGVEDGYFFTIDRSMALLAILDGFDSDELNYFEKRKEAEIEAPGVKLAAFFQNEPSALLMDTTRFGGDSRVLKPIEGAENRQKMALLKVTEPRRSEGNNFRGFGSFTRSRIRMAQEELDAALNAGALVLQKLYTSRVFAKMNEEQIDAFWTSQRLKRGDWHALTEAKLGRAFGHSILTPLEESVKAFRISVRPAGIDTIVDSVLSGSGLSLDGEVQGHTDEEPMARVESDLPQLPAMEVCSGALAAYGSRM